MKNNTSQCKSKSGRVFALFCLLLGSILLAPSVSAQITVSLKNTTIGKAIEAIKKQSDYNFFYEDQVANLPVSDFQVNNKSVNESLDILLKDKNVSYKVEDRIVYLSLKNQPSTLNQPVSAKEKRMITGMVIDENQEPLIGVSVTVKDTKIGTTTDVDGKYRIEVPGDKTHIQFSYIGYNLHLVSIGTSNVIDVILKENAQVLSEVVVTALGIKREKKLLGYSIQELKGEDLTATGNASVVGALQGKVAGVQMNISPTGLNGSTKITIRGNSSLTDNNQPLWVIDGIPYGDNSNSSVSLYGGIDRGGTSVDINPEDIETMSVLKGPNAAALYGSRAGNGVILITTKKGTGVKGFGVNYSNTLTWTEVVETLDLQTTYGQGLSGIYNKATPFSYGGRLDGSDTPAWWVNNDGATVPYSLNGNKLKDYFNTGFSQNHTLSIGNVTEDSHYRLSFGYLDSDGLFDGETLEKFSADLNAGKKINKYISMDSKLSLSKTKAENRPYLGRYGEMYQLTYLPNNIRLGDLEEHYTRTETLEKDGQDYEVHQNWSGPTQDILNPYWLHNQRTNMDDRWRAFGYHSMKISFTDWLSATGKLSLDYYRTKIEETDRGKGENATNVKMNDTFTKAENNYYEMNAEFLFSGFNRIGENIRVDYSLGGNAMYKNWESLSGSARNMAEKDNWYLNNAGQAVVNDESAIPSFVNQYLDRRRTNSLYGMFQIAYGGYVSLDMTLRRDWSSTLLEAYNYPSFNLSFIATDFMQHQLNMDVPSWLTYAKLRGSYAKAGKDTDPYALSNYITWDQSFTGPKYTLSSIYVTSDFKPEMNTSYELGLEMKFLQNRIGFDFTYYKSLTRNQIMNIPFVSVQYNQKRINAGEIQNEGLEFALYTIPVKTKNFEFGLDLNVAHNTTMVNELYPTVKWVDFATDNFFATVVALEGKKMGDIVAKSIIKRDANGNMIISQQSGLPEVVTSGPREDRIIGNIQPDLIASVAPRISYKNIYASALFDMKFGGEILSATEAIATHYGMAKRTENRDGMLTLPGVDAAGNANTKQVTYEEYYRFIGNAGGDAGLAEEFIYDASYIKLRELAVGYSFSSKLLKKTPFNMLKLSFVARNLCYLLKHTPGTNPEGGFDTRMYSQAFDFLTTPNTRTLGFSLNVGF